MYSLSEPISRRILTYYFGADHRAKMRIFSLLHRLAGSPRFTVPFGSGALSLDIGDYLQFEILRSGDFEPEVWNALAAYCLKDEVVWDVGANIGSVAVRAAQHPRVARVYAFEPNPSVFAALAVNRRLNPGLPLHPLPLALGDKNAVQPLFVGIEGNSGVAGFHPYWTKRSVPVECRTGDALVQEGICAPPTLLKIDVEGYELQVLQGLEKTLRAHPPKAIIFEGHLQANGATNSQPVLDFLQSLGMHSRLSGDTAGRETVNYLATGY